MKRRQFLLEAGGGLGALALNSLEAATHHPAKAKRVISLFMSGGVSHLDTFDPKPALARFAGQPLSGKGDIVVRQGHPGPLMPSPFAFRRHGQSGLEVSELFPKLGALCDEYALVRSAFSKSNDHVQAHYALASGQIRMGFPSLGAWVSYGLGSLNQDLPGYVVLYDQRGGPFGGPANWTAGFMPAAYQGTVFRAANQPILDLQPPPGVSAAEQRQRLAALRQLNSLDAARAPSNSELTARLDSYELAYRMQSAAPDAVDLSSESPATRRLYGLDEAHTEPFGRQCLMARRLAESGVRFIQVNYTDNSNNPAWDQHSNMPKHKDHALAVDKPIAGLLQDLKQRGLLEDTLVWWGGEFGRTPYAQGNGTGRDHNPGGFCQWLAGAGVKPGFSFGETDEFGHHAIADKVHMHDMHATILHLLGLDHEKLTYPHAGRNFRLTDVHGHVVKDLLT